VSHVRYCLVGGGGDTSRSSPRARRLEHPRDFAHGGRSARRHCRYCSAHAREDDIEARCCRTHFRAAPFCTSPFRPRLRHRVVRRPPQRCCRGDPRPATFRFRPRAGVRAALRARSGTIPPPPHPSTPHHQPNLVEILFALAPFRSAVVNLHKPSPAAHAGPDQRLAIMRIASCLDPHPHRRVTS